MKIGLGAYRVIGALRWAKGIVEIVRVAVVVVRATWWSAVFLVNVAYVVSKTHYRNDGDPSVHFASWWDVAYLGLLVSCLTLEVQSIATRIVCWWRARS